ncbi:MAG TPA: dynamin family protein [Actinomycetales bacterium]|nr:dynamin family protein [Actinomycetales bacterium]
MSRAREHADDRSTQADHSSFSAARLLTALEHLRAEVERTRLPLQLPDVDDARTDLARLLDQMDDYLLPRLRQLDAPLLAVVGGSTGAGKSTLVNTLLGREVSKAGVLRPTTRAPVMVHHPDDTQWFTSGRVLPHLARLTGEEGEHFDGKKLTSLRLVSSDALPPGLSLVDAPDIDSVVEANRELANQLLAAADLWLFVTTAARYADAVPWELLKTAAERGTSVAVVLDRVPPDAMAEVRSDLAVMLRQNDLATAPLFTIPESVTGNGLLPDEDIAPLRRWLVNLASDARARSMVVRRTLTGALESLATRVPRLAEAADKQDAAARALVDDVEAAYAEADRQLEKGLTDGSLLRGEVLARWQEFVGTGEFFRGLESAIGRLRDRITAAIRGRPAPAEPLGEALQTGVAALVRAQAEDAVERTAGRWRARPAGAALLDAAGPDVTRLSPDFDARLERQVRDWQRYVFDLVRAEGQGRRTQARVLSFGVNALGVVLMLTVFASTAFIPTGAEVGVAAGSALIGQRLLEAIFGDQAVRELAAKARADLTRRVDELLAAEQARMVALLDNAGVDPSAAGRLRAASDDVQTSFAGMPMTAR